MHTHVRGLREHARSRLEADLSTVGRRRARYFLLAQPTSPLSRRRHDKRKGGDVPIADASVSPRLVEKPSYRMHVEASITNTIINVKPSSWSIGARAPVRLIGRRTRRLLPSRHCES